MRVVIIGGDGPEPTLYLAGRDGSRVRLAGPLRSAVTGADVVVWTRTVDGRAANERDLTRTRDLGLPAFPGLGATGLCTLLRTLPVFLADVAVVAAAAPRPWTVVVGDQAGVLAQAAAGPLDGRVLGVGSGSALVARTHAALRTAADGPATSGACVEVDFLGIDRIGWLRSLRVDGQERLTELLTDPARLAGLADARVFPPGALAAAGAVATADVHRSLAWRDLTPAADATVAPRSARTGGIAGTVIAGAPVAASGERSEGGSAGRPTVTPQDGGENRGAVVAGLLAALRGAPGRLILHTVNAGTVPALPPRLVLELSCRVDPDGPRPDPIHTPGLGQLGLLAAVRDAELLAIGAVRSGSRAQAERALAASALVASAGAARTVLDGLLSDHPALRSVLRSG